MRYHLVDYKMDFEDSMNFPTVRKNVNEILKKDEYGEHTYILNDIIKNHLQYNEGFVLLFEDRFLQESYPEISIAMDLDKTFDKSRMIINSKGFKELDLNSLKPNSVIIFYDRVDGYKGEHGEFVDFLTQAREKNLVIFLKVQNFRYLVDLIMLDINGYATVMKSEKEDEKGYWIKYCNMILNTSSKIMQFRFPRIITGDGVHIIKGKDRDSANMIIKEAPKKFIKVLFPKESKDAK